MITFLKKSVKVINNAFMDLILIIVYFVAIGLSSLLFHILIRLKKKKKESFWEESEPISNDLQNFTSGY